LDRGVASGTFRATSPNVEGLVANSTNDKSVYRCRNGRQEMSSLPRTTRLEKVMDWIAVVDIAILIVATIALIAGLPQLPFGAPAPSTAADAAVTLALAHR
jgi:hypothetical protein